MAKTASGAGAQRLSAGLGVLLAVALYFTGLSAMGLVGPDEPRYAAIGREMARSGDWITPKLWGAAWFEKPALLYWMTAAGFRAGLGAELGPRLPVALVSVAFLVFFALRVRRLWGAEMAAAATAILATSAGWLAYSHVAVTDIPVSVFFGAAVLLAIEWATEGKAEGLTAAAACLGVATLAKGLVPIVLFLPVLVMGRKSVGAWLRPGPLVAFALTALPWYVLCTARNGLDFLRVFFIEQQFNRIGSTALQHVQPFWFYLPAALLLLFPWFPLVVLGAPVKGDRKLKLLAAVAGWGFLFFSISINKLPSYLLPLLPMAAILIASGVVSASGRGKVALIACCALLAVIPVLPTVVAEGLRGGLRSAKIPWASLVVAMMAGATGGAVLLRRGVSLIRAAIPVALAAGVAFLWLEVAGFPLIERTASSRAAWLRDHPRCVAPTPRTFAYGLYYYSGAQLPACDVRPDENSSPR